MWTRISSNMAAGCYDVRIAEQGMGEPDWPEDETLSSLLEKAFGTERLISSADHPIIKKLRGQSE